MHPNQIFTLNGTTYEVIVMADNGQTVVCQDSCHAVITVPLSVACSGVHTGASES